ncbi:MAG: formate--tetrahydrofolate ligase [Nitrososphaerales archaeon]
MRPIAEIARDLGLSPEQTSNYGKLVAKIALRSSPRKRAKLVLVTAINPTPRGEGKTVTSIGLSMALNKLGHRAIICSRQPSLGPLFGVKGGAAGGGRSTLEPMQQINMHFTGDIDAISSAHNLLAAMIDNHIYQGNSEPRIEPKKITWRRTLDMNDRSLRHTTIGVGEKREGVERDDGFVITAASEVMTTLCLASGYSDLKDRLARIIIGYSPTDEPVRARDLLASGAMAALLRDALQPNLAQTCEGTPALIHGGPFGNIATGTCSLVSILLGLELSEYCVVEAGFGSDLGAEKFFDIVSRLGGFNVDAVLIVASVKALKYHGHERLQSGLENLQKHIENMKTFGAAPVVAINRFSSDSDEELKIVAKFCFDLGVPSAVSEVFDKGGSGAIELASLVVEASKRKLIPRPVYEMDDKIEDKIWKVSTMVYGARDVEFTLKAREDLERISSLGLTGYPICVAKTPFSLSDDPKKLGRPRDFSVTVDGIDIASGPGFHVVKMGSVLMMPGLPPRPAAESFDLTIDGTIIGVF